jgi:DNA-binding winged helix-turn-helix (wHTH) protein
MPQARPRYRFAEFTLSPARRALSRGGKEVPLIPRYLDLLLLLVERRTVALHRHEIFDRVWSDVVVSDGALSQAVRTLRRTLGEDGDRVFVRTVSRHGYQFVCPVVEEQDGDDDAVADAAGSPSGTPPPLAPGRIAPTAEAIASAADPIAAGLARLLDPAAPDETLRDAAEDLHALGTGEALRRLGRRPGHARGWAHLRDSRWDVAGAGPVPLLTPPAGPAAWAALAGLRFRRALRLAGSRWAGAALGGAAAGAFAGLAGGLAMAALGGSSAPSLLGALVLVGALVAGVGAAGVGGGLAAAEALVRSRRAPALALLGAASGGFVGFVSSRVAAAVLEGLFGVEHPSIGDGFEGVCVGAAAGVGYGLATRRMVGGAPAPRGRARRLTIAATALACGLAGVLVSLSAGRLGAASLASIVEAFPATRVRLDVLGRPLGEDGLGPRTRAVLGAGEGLLFGAGLAAGLTRRPRRPESR